MASHRCLATNQLSLSLVIFRHQVALSDMYPASSHWVLFKSEKKNLECNLKFSHKLHSVCEGKLNFQMVMINVGQSCASFFPLTMKSFMMKIFNSGLYIQDSVFFSVWYVHEVNRTHPSQVRIRGGGGGLGKTLTPGFEEPELSIIRLNRPC